MIDSLYELLKQMGYIHPLHPVLVHGPIGGVIVAFCFGLSFLMWRRQSLMQSAYQVVAIAFGLYFPTVLFGLMDWQHFYSGGWIFPIKMKIALATLLLILLTSTLIIGRRPNVRPSLMIIMLLLCLFNIIALGYFGGKLVYEGKTPSVENWLSSGRTIFEAHCSGCHANGGNIIFPNLPLCTAPQLANYEVFSVFVRNPKLPNNSPGPMPTFTEHELPDPQLKELYEYITYGLAKK